MWNTAVHWIGLKALPATSLKFPFLFAEFSLNCQTGALEHLFPLLGCGLRSLVHVHQSYSLSFQEIALFLQLEMWGSADCLFGNCMGGLLILCSSSSFSTRVGVASSPMSVPPTSREHWVWDLSCPQTLLCHGFAPHSSVHSATHICIVLSQLKWLECWLGSLFPTVL